MTETIPEMLWSATSEGAVDYYNARALAYTGFRLKKSWATHGRNFFIQTMSDQTVRRVGEPVLPTGAPYRAEVRAFHAA